MLETFFTKMLEGFAHTTGAVIVLIPSFLCLARYSEHQRMQSMQKGLKELPNHFLKMFKVDDRPPLSTSPVQEHPHHHHHHQQKENFLENWTSKFK